jgi:hypothetical protein
MSIKALIISGTGGAVAIIAAALYFLPAAAADASADEGLAGMPANCPMWDEAESTDAAGMYEQCRSSMSASGMGHMMSMMHGMGSCGMNMSSSCGMAGQEDASEAPSCPLTAAEPDTAEEMAAGCHQAESES